jgi:hypothetical protein
MDNYGKIFDSLYKGSMVGSGSHVFAVWGYVIANMQPNKDRVFFVDLEPKHLSIIIGEEKKNIMVAIDYLCSPDEEESRRDVEDGRRLVHVEGKRYRVVKAAEYYEKGQGIKRKEQVRLAQQKYRNNHK